MGKAASITKVLLLGIILVFPLPQVKAQNSARTIKATNTIYHDRDHASALILPVIGGK